MAVYQITFTPSGPYFFGNEKGFTFADGRSGEYGKLYYIKGETTPLQTTLLGALRYLLLPEKTFAAAQEAAPLIGAESFDPDSEKIQTFGAIGRISPLFLCRDDEWFVPTPFDHNEASPRRAEGKVFYTPFANYALMETVDGVRLYTPDYSPKMGITSGYMSLSDGHIENSLFTTDTRAGLNNAISRDAFFKKDFMVLKDGFGFSVLADIREDIAAVPEKAVVMLGQNKVPFLVKITKQDFSVDELLGRIAKILSVCRKDVRYPEGKCYRFVYAPADAMPAGNDTKTLYDQCVFAVTKFRLMRNIKTKRNPDGGTRFHKSAALNRLVKGGSVFIVEQGQDIPCLTDLQSTQIANARTIGCNGLVWEKEN